MAWISLFLEIFCVFLTLNEMYIEFFLSFFQMEKKIVNALYKYKFERTTDDLQINLVVKSDKIQVVLYFSFDSLHLRNQREIVEDLLENIPIENDWYLVPLYFITKVESSNCKHKNFTVFTILKNRLVE